MSSRKNDQEQWVNDSTDNLIRWALHDSVAGAEPSSRVWERIEGRIAAEMGNAVAPLQPRRKVFWRRLSLAWLVGAGADNLVPADPRFAGQRRLRAYDTRTPQSVVRLVECTMPALRLVA